MAKLSFILDKKKPNPQGLFPLKLKISTTGTSTCISTNIYCKEKYFLGTPPQIVSKVAPQAKEINANLNCLYQKYYSAIVDLERNGQLKISSPAQIRMYANKSDKREETKISFSKVLLDVMNNYKNVGTKKICNYTNSLLQTFFNNDDIDFNDINYRSLFVFDKWMEDKGIHTNTRSIIMRQIRRVFNKAIEDDMISQSLYPFRKFKIKQAEKEKEFLSLDKFRLLMNADLQGGMAVARDFFLLSFFFCGINPIDLFYLKKPLDGIITFVRTKIAHKEPMPIHIKVQPEAQKIIDKYAGDNYMLCFAEHYANYKTFQSYINKRLRKVGKELAFEKCYYYLARYTWATYADKIGVSERIIGKALGHTGTSLADKRYISFDWGKVDVANRNVIDYVLNGED